MEGWIFFLLVGVRTEWTGPVPLFAGNRTSTWVRSLKGPAGLVEMTVTQRTVSCGVVFNETVCWPRILVAGVHKSATTAVWTMLGKHPEIEVGGKENNLICGLTDKSWLSYVRKVGSRLARSKKLMTLEATPSMTYCGTENMGLTKRLQIVDRLLRPKIVFLHRNPVDRAWSEYRFFSAFNRQACGIPSSLGFRESVQDQIFKLTSFCPDDDDDDDECAKEMQLQLLHKLPYLPCHRITRIVLGFSRYFQAKYEAVFGHDRILNIDFHDARLPETYNRIFRFLGLSPTSQSVPIIRPEEDAFNRRFNFSFPAHPGDDPDRLIALTNLSQFYATFNPSILDNFVDY